MMYLLLNGTEKLPITNSMAESLKAIQHCHELLRTKWTGEIKKNGITIKVIYE